MEQLNISDNLIKLRKQRKITQETLANFLGVTKGSVSKWENSQTLPDILLLPRIAAFFGVSVDELLGYEPQLSKEQIRKIYVELCRDFTVKPFQEVIEKTEDLVKKYYSCYPFLEQICILWINHFMLAGSKEEQQKILKKIDELCDRIIENGGAGISEDAVIIKAMCGLQQGRTREVIEVMEEISNPYRLVNQSNAILIQAYQTAKEDEKAYSFAEISIYINLIAIITNMVQFLGCAGIDKKKGEETIKRGDNLIEVWQVTKLHPNIDANFQYQSAIFYSIHNEQDKAVERLRRYKEAVKNLYLDGKPLFHGDGYFDKVDQWIEKLDLGANPPRDKAVVIQSAVQALDHPIFSEIAGRREMKEIKKEIASIL